VARTQFALRTHPMRPNADNPINTLGNPKRVAPNLAHVGNSVPSAFASGKHGSHMGQAFLIDAQKYA